MPKLFRNAKGQFISRAEPTRLVEAAGAQAEARPVRVRNLGPGKTERGKMARHNIVRIYASTAAAIQGYFQANPRLDNYFAYISARGFVTSDSGGKRARYGDLSISPSRTGHTYATMTSYVRQTIETGLANFDPNEIEYMDIHLLVREDVR